MNKYRILDNDIEEYIVEGKDALDAIINWIRKYNNPEIIDLIAEDNDVYFTRLRIMKINE